LARRHEFFPPFLVTICFVAYTVSIISWFLLHLYHCLCALNMLDLIIISSYLAGLLFYLDQQSLLLVRVMRRRMTGNLI
jgi:hypothetical protein